MKNKTVTINGRKYNSVTGKPTGKSTSTNEKTPNTKTPLASRPKTIDAIKRGVNIARHASVSRFSPVSVNKKTPSKPSQEHKNGKTMDIAHTTHPLVAKVNSIRESHQTTPVHCSAKVIKEEAIKIALSKAESLSSNKNNKKSRLPKWLLITIISISSVFAIIIASLSIYYFVPSVSVWVANKQARIEAKFPNYIPKSYRISGPASYEEGKVTIYLKSTTAKNEFILTQTRSSLDSSALKNRINTDSKGSFLTTTFSGLTIFTYDDSAAWINDGILYEIKGDATLPNDQIRQFAIGLTD